MCLRMILEKYLQSSQETVQEMTQEQAATSSEIRPATPTAGKRRLVFLCISLAVLLFYAANPAPIKAAWAEFASIIQLKSAPLPASPAKLSDHEIILVAKKSSLPQSKS